jgi:transposase-like protein
MTKHTPPFSPEVRERAVRMVLEHQGEHDTQYGVYRPRIVRHRSEAYAAKAAGGSCAVRMAAGGRNPCRSISHVSL